MSLALAFDEFLDVLDAIADGVLDDADRSLVLALSPNVQDFVEVIDSNTLGGGGKSGGLCFALWAWWMVHELHRLFSNGDPIA